MTTKTEALKLTDEQIEDFVFKHGGKWDGNHWTFEDADLHPFVRSIEALAPPEQEPVDVETVYETIIKWDEGGGKRSRRELTRRIVELYTSPPKREWVGLTDDEILYARVGQWSEVSYARAIEAKLKEKNT